MACGQHANTSYNNHIMEQYYEIGMQEEAAASEIITMRKGPWHEEEDERLTAVVSILGERRWDALAKASGLRRSGKSCRLRWMNYLRPNLKHGHITEQEELLILQLHKQWGNRWSRIARSLPGRTDNEIKNYWRSHLRKKAFVLQQQEQQEISMSDSGERVTTTTTNDSEQNSGVGLICDEGALDNTTWMQHITYMSGEWDSHDHKDGDDHDYHNLMIKTSTCTATERDHHEISNSSCFFNGLAMAASYNYSPRVSTDWPPGATMENHDDYYYSSGGGSNGGYHPNRYTNSWPDTTSQLSIWDI